MNHEMPPEQVEVLEFAERVALLLGCLRNYRKGRSRIDLEGALSLEPEVARLLARVRARLPRPF